MKRPSKTKLATFYGVDTGRFKSTLAPPKLVKKQPSGAEEAFARAWARSGGTPAIRELKFHPDRKWRFDFAWPDVMLALEIDGRGRHDSVGGQRKDFEKNNEAVRLGWRVLHVQAMQVKQVAQWCAMVKEMLSGKTQRHDT